MSRDVSFAFCLLSSRITGKSLTLIVCYSFSYNPGASVSQDTGVVDLSNLALSNGKAFVHPNISCFLCGNAGGLKMKCNNEGCRVGGDNKSMHVAFHVTCARQAGLEVNSTDDRRRKTNFYRKFDSQVNTAAAVPMFNSPSRSQ